MMHTVRTVSVIGKNTFKKAFFCVSETSIIRLKQGGKYLAAENRGFKMADDLCADMEMFVMKMDKVCLKLLNITKCILFCVLFTISGESMGRFTPYIPSWRRAEVPHMFSTYGKEQKKLSTTGGTEAKTSTGSGTNTEISWSQSGQG